MWRSCRSSAICRRRTRSACSARWTRCARSPKRATRTSSASASPSSRATSSASSWTIATRATWRSGSSGSGRWATASSFRRRRCSGGSRSSSPASTSSTRCTSSTATSSRRVSASRRRPATLARASEASAHTSSIPHCGGARADLFLHRGSELKIGDLGLSKQILAGIAGAQKHTQCGSPVYLAPEVHMSQAYDGKVDIWAAGCTLYEVMMLRRAFTGDDMEEILAKVVYAVRAPRRRRRQPRGRRRPRRPRRRHCHSNTARSLATGRPNWRSCCSRCSGCAPRSGRRRASSSRARTSRRRWRRSTRRPSRTWCAPRRRRRRPRGASSSPVASARDACVCRGRAT